MVRLRRNQTHSIPHSPRTWDHAFIGHRTGRLGRVWQKENLQAVEKVKGRELGRLSSPPALFALFHVYHTCRVKCRVYFIRVESTYAYVPRSEGILCAKTHLARPQRIRLGSILYARRIGMSPTIKHYMNPLHIYCRLRNLGIAKSWAACLVRYYERQIFNRYFMAREQKLAYDPLPITYDHDRNQKGD